MWLNEEHEFLTLYFDKFDLHKIAVDRTIEN